MWLRLQRNYIAYRYISTQNSMAVEAKVVPVLNSTPRHEDGRGSGGTDPRILNLGAG
jgi:hypothetical protein